MDDPTTAIHRTSHRKWITLKPNLIGERITAPTNVPSGTRRPVLVTGWATTVPVLPAPVVLVDRDGDEWREAGLTALGETLLACDNPQSADDRGEGESFAWTPRSVALCFGPLVHRLDGAL